VPHLLIRLQDTPALRSPAWVGQHLWAIVAVVACVPVVTWLLRTLGDLRRLRALRLVPAAIWVSATWAAPWVIFVLLVSWAGTFFYGLSETIPREDVPWTAVLLWHVCFWSTLFGAVLVDPLPGMISPSPTVHVYVKPLLRNHPRLEQLCGSGRPAGRNCAEFTKATDGQ
jgi:hypothetical protein